MIWTGAARPLPVLDQLDMSQRLAPPPPERVEQLRERVERMMRPFRTRSR